MKCLPYTYDIPLEGMCHLHFHKNYRIYFTKVNSKYSIYLVSGKIKIKCHPQLDSRMHRKIAIIIIRKDYELLNYHIK